MRRWALAGALILLGAGPIAAARAQTGDTLTIPPQTAQPDGPSDQATTTPSESSAVPDTLGEQLSKSDGVIAPPHTGDTNVVAPPDGGTSRTPVIPAPGTPGGNPMIDPK